MPEVKNHVRRTDNMTDEKSAVGQKYKIECRRDVKWKNDGGALRCRENRAMRS